MQSVDVHIRDSSTVKNHRSFSGPCPYSKRSSLEKLKCHQIFLVGTHSCVFPTPRSIFIRTCKHQYVFFLHIITTINYVLVVLNNMQKLHLLGSLF